VKRAWRLAAGVSFALAVAACTTDLTATPTARPGSSLATATATIQPPTSFGPPPSASFPDDTTPLTLDGSLLDVLPPTVEGIPLTEDLDIASDALTDPVLPNIATAADAAVAVDVGSGNLVSAWVIRLRPGVLDDAGFRQWRDAYDDGACAAAGGVVGRAEATIGGRQAFVTSCVAGLHTYHVWLKDQDILVTASSIGDARYGERMLEGLRVPASPAPS
jgi:hypothetical protein